MTRVNADKAEGTAALLQEAAHGGFPVMIPGGFEKRASRPLVTAIARIAEPAPRGRAAAADDRERLEHEREGGGAPSQRTSAAVRSRP